MLVGLVARMEEAGIDEISDRICEALCNLTGLTRAGLFLYDPARRVTRPAGSHGVDRDLLNGVEVSLDEAPLAQRALAEDRVIEVTEGLEFALPRRYVDRPHGITTINCGPIAAGGQWFGVILADQGGEPYQLTDEERQTMHTLGRLAALAATIERSTSQRERARNLDARIDLIREIHEQVIQRLFGLSLALGSDEPLTGEERRRFRDELQVVLSELRTALGRRLGPERPPTSTTLREMLEHRALASAVRLDWSEGTVTPEHLEPLAQSVAIEALRNAEHHSDGGPVDVSVATEGDTFVLSVVNGGARTDRPGGGLGLRLLTLEALQHDGLVEFGPFGEDGWRVRLLAPVDER